MATARLLGLTWPISRSRSLEPELTGLNPEFGFAGKSHSQLQGRAALRSLLIDMLDKVARQKLVVIGNGMAGIRTVEELLARAPHLYDITVFGSEPYGNYNRILLSPVLTGDNGATLHKGKTPAV